MNFFLRLRLPFREDALFSLLAFTVFLLPLAFNTVFYEKFEVPKWALWLILTGCAFFVFFKKSWLDNSPNEKKVFFSKILLWLLGLLLVAAVISTAWSVNKLNSFLGFYPRFSNGLLFYVVWTSFIVLLLSVVNRIKFIFLAKILSFDVLLISIFGILQSLGIGYYEGFDQPSGLLRGPSLLGNANFSTMFLVIALPLVLYLLLEAKLKAARLYFGFVALSVVFSCVVLSSRGALLALGGSLVIFFVGSLLLGFKKKYFLTGLVCLVLASSLWYGLLRFTRPSVYQSTAQLQEVNVNLRFYAWDIARTGIFQHPLTGIGLGNFQILFERERGTNLSTQNGVYDDPHNYFLHLASSGGLPFLAMFLAIVGYCLYCAYKSARYGKDPLGLAIFSGMVAFGLSAAFTPVALPCLLLLGVTIVGSQLQETQNKSIFWPKTVRLAGKVFGLVFIIAGLCFISGEYLFSKSYGYYFAQDYERSYKLADWAVRLNPTNQYYYIYRAGSAAYLRKPAEMERDINRIVRMQPKDAKTYVSAGNIYFSLYAITLEKQYLDKSLEFMQKSLPLDPLLAPRYGFVGYLYYLETDYEQALEYTKGSLQLNPKQIPAWMLLARIYQMQNKRTQMVYALEQARDIDPESEVLQYIYKSAESQADISKVFIPVAILPGSLE